MATRIRNQQCPCDPTKLYKECCEPFHRGAKIASSAEQLMRSRYSAYALQLDSYLKETWHLSSRPTLDRLCEPTIKWINLTIDGHWPSEQPNEAFVEFTARCKINGKAEKMHEISRFVYENARWYYLEGKLS